MNYSVYDLEYHERLGEWSGNITVKCSQALFNKTEMALQFYIKSTEALAEVEYNTLNYIKTNFSDIYENILKGLYEWYKSGYIPSEIFNESNANFIPVQFNSYEDIHKYIGTPYIELLHECIKDEFVYFAIYFTNDCLLSIEHGITALFYKSNMIDIDAADTEAVVDSLKYYEDNCTLWKKDFWLVIQKLGDNESLDDIELIRKKWLK